MNIANKEIFEVFYELAKNKKRLKIDVFQSFKTATANEHNLKVEYLYEYDDLVNDIIRKIMLSHNIFSVDEQNDITSKLKKDAKGEKKKIISDKKAKEEKTPDEIETKKDTKIDIGKTGLIITTIGIFASFTSVIYQLSQDINFETTTNEFNMNLLIIANTILIILVLIGIIFFITKISTWLTSKEEKNIATENEGSNNKTAEKEVKESIQKHK